MVLRRMSLVLCLIVFVTSCTPEPEKIAEEAWHVIEFYDKTRPIQTAVVGELFPTPIPTLGAPGIIQKYFKLASSPGCERFTSQYGSLESIYCSQSAVEIRFDYWLSQPALDKFLNSLFASPGIQITNKRTWNVTENPDIQLGDLYEFIDNDGNSNILWTVTKNGLSGWGRRADNNQTALYNWWAETGSAHK